MAKPILIITPRSVAEASVTEEGGAYSLQGTVIEEGLSANFNFYSLDALKSAPAVFAGKAIYADHPSIREEQDRPERSIHALVGRLPESVDDFWVEEGTNGTPAKLKFRNAKLSQTAGWLATMIREQIAGDMSINAMGSGNDQADGSFHVTEFHDATSLDFVTTAAAGGLGELVESVRTRTLEGLTVKQLSDHCPDLLNQVAARERSKVYSVGKRTAKLRERQARIVANQKRQQLTAAAKLRQMRVSRAAAMGVLSVTGRGLRESRLATMTDRVLAGSGLPAAGRARVMAQFEPMRQKFLAAKTLKQVKAQEGDMNAADWVRANGDADDIPAFEKWLTDQMGEDPGLASPDFVWADLYQKFYNADPAETWLAAKRRLRAARRRTQEQGPMTAAEFARANLNPGDIKAWLAWLGEVGIATDAQLSSDEWAQYVEDWRVSEPGLIGDAFFGDRGYLAARRRTIEAQTWYDWARELEGVYQEWEITQFGDWLEENIPDFNTEERKDYGFWSSHWDKYAQAKGLEAERRKGISAQGDLPPTPTSQTEPGTIAPVGADLQPSDPPAIELPPDAAQLPEEAQSLWLENYVVCLATDTEAACMHGAWAAIADAGWKQDNGAWALTSTMPAVPQPDTGMTDDVFTDDELQGARRRFRAYRRRLRAQNEIDAYTYIRQIGGGMDEAAWIKFLQAMGVNPDYKWGEPHWNQLWHDFMDPDITFDEARRKHEGQDLLIDTEGEWYAFEAAEMYGLNSEETSAFVAWVDTTQGQNYMAGGHTWANLLSDWEETQEGVLATRRIRAQNEAIDLKTFWSQGDVSGDRIGFEDFLRDTNLDVGMMASLNEWQNLFDRYQSDMGTQPESKRRAKAVLTGERVWRDWIGTSNLGLAPEVMGAWTLEDWTQFVEAFVAEMGDALDPIYAKVPEANLAQLLFDYAQQTQQANWRRPKSRQAEGEAPELPTMLGRARARLRELVAAERQYIGAFLDRNMVSGMGASDGGTQRSEEAEAGLESAFSRLGLNAEQAKIATAGRKRR